MSRPTPHKPETFIGKTVAGRYAIKSVLGAGGMGAVFVAEQQPLGREVALKIIKQSLADDPDAVARFEQEARTVSQLSHPNLITIYDFGHDEDGTLFIAMELLKGRSLRELLHAEKHLEWSRTLPIVSDVCRALVEAHRAGIIHRDLKPDNVMLLDKDREYAKVLDFGVAKLLESDGKLTSTGVLVGTPGYIAPEQMNGVTGDPRSDLYALGVLWYEMLSGLSPFHDSTPMRLAVKHMTEPPPPLRARVPGYGIPDEVEALVMRLLEKSPEARAPSTEAFLAELDALWARTGSLPPGAATETAMASPVALPPPPNLTPPNLTPTPATPVPSNPQAPMPAPPVVATPPQPPAPVAPPTPQPVPVKSGCSTALLITLGVFVLLFGTCGAVVVIAGLSAQEQRELLADGYEASLEAGDVKLTAGRVPAEPPEPPEPPVAPGASDDGVDALDRLPRELKHSAGRRISRDFIKALNAGDVKAGRAALRRAEKLAKRNPAAAAELEERFTEALSAYATSTPTDGAGLARKAARMSTLSQIVEEEAAAGGLDLGELFGAAAD